MLIFTVEAALVLYLRFVFILHRKDGAEASGPSGKARTIFCLSDIELKPASEL